MAAAVGAAASSLTFHHAAAAPAAALVQVAQNDAAKCVNGYRLTHVIKGPGRTSGGVLLRCRG
jgi:hypothetical protein